MERRSEEIEWAALLSDPSARAQGDRSEGRLIRPSKVFELL